MPFGNAKRWSLHLICGQSEWVVVLLQRQLLSGNSLPTEDRPQHGLSAVLRAARFGLRALLAKGGREAHFTRAFGWVRGKRERTEEDVHAHVEDSARADRVRSWPQRNLARWVLRWNFLKTRLDSVATQRQQKTIYNWQRNCIYLEFSDLNCCRSLLYSCRTLVIKLWRKDSKSLRARPPASSKTAPQSTLGSSIV